MLEFLSFNFPFLPYTKYKQNPGMVYMCVGLDTQCVWQAYLCSAHEINPLLNGSLEGGVPQGLVPAPWEGTDCLEAWIQGVTWCNSQR